MIEASEQLGGIETVVEGLNGKSQLYQRIFSNQGQELLANDLYDACAFMPTVRRRLQHYLTNNLQNVNGLIQAVQNLLCDVAVDNVDRKFDTLENELSASKRDRWMRDFAAEIVHYGNPEVYPLMTRWVWDFQANTGVLREIWYSEYDLNRLNIPNGIATHLELRRELTQFLKDLGVYKDMALMIDVYLAWIYAQYIGNQGDSFLKTDFSSSEVSFHYALRMLGLDVASTVDGKSKLLLANGKRYRLSGIFDATCNSPSIH